MALNRTLQKTAKQLQKRIGGHARMHGLPNLDQDVYLQARAESDRAYSLARYLAQYLDAPPEDRLAFLAACGLGSHHIH